MTQTISRMYASNDDAMAAATELEAYRVFAGRVHVVGPPAADPSDGAGANDLLDSIVDAITKGYILRRDAKIYAEGVRNGGTLVSVHAQLGTALLATGILDRHGPIDSGIPEPEPDRGMVWDEATPMSCILVMPVLSSDPTPFSTWWNLKVLTEGRWSLSRCLGLPMLSSSRVNARDIAAQSRNPAPLSRLINMPTLSRNPAPLSSLLKIPVLRGG